MAKFTNPKRGKRNIQNLDHALRIVIATHRADSVDPEAWDNYESMEPIQRTRFDLSD